jgi:predicted phosphodiesterase
MSRILVIGDLHEPVAHPGYIHFCRDLYRKFKCNQVIFIGDVVDWHAISFHTKEPECPGPLDEYKEAKARVRRWYRAFPKSHVCIGNHDCRPERLAKTAAIPACFLKDYNTLWETPGWTWDYDFLIDEVFYTHGIGTAGIHPAWNKSGKMLMSVVMGHCHARSGVKWRVNPLRRIFAMDIGCGIDNDAYQFVYGRACDDKPILSAGVVLDGEPIHCMMPMAKGEKYHKSRFVKEKR